MKRFLLDSGAMSDFLNRRSPFIEHVCTERKNGNRIGTAVPIIAELHYGLQLSDSYDKNIEKLNRGKAELIVWPFDLEAAEKYGQIAAQLRRIGRPMQTIDIMIAAIAMKLGNCTVISTDRDLESVPGLSVSNWSI